MNLNKVFIIGRLTVDPQVRTTPSGMEVATFGVATNRNWTDKSGEKKEATEFHNIVVWGKQASIVHQFLTKGSTIFIEGRLQTRSWEGKDGLSRRTTEVIAERVQLGPKPSGTGKEPSFNSSDTPLKEDMPVIDIDGDDIKPEDLPF
jgi:single-strand DNA-binding protein